MLASCCLDNSLRHALQAIIIQIHGRYANPSMFYATKSEQVYGPFDIWILIPSILQILIPLRLILFSIAHGLLTYSCVKFVMWPPPTLGMLLLRTAEMRSSSQPSTRMLVATRVTASVTMMSGIDG